jgi:glycerol uptake facilitator protein
MNIFFGELLGTLLLILLGNGVVANVLLSQSKGNGGGWIVIAAGWGFAVGIAVYVAGWVSGAHLNPAVTLGFIAAGTTKWSELPYYLTGQFGGAMLGQVLVWLAYLPHWAATENPLFKLVCFCTRPALRHPWMNLMTEIIATAVLLIGLLGIFNTHNGIGSGFGPYAVGILIYAIGLSLGGPTGYAINPARDLGPRIMHAILPIAGKGDSDWGYAWIPVVGPLIGSLIGTYIYIWFSAQAGA